LLNLSAKSPARISSTRLLRGKLPELDARLPTAAMIALFILATRFVLVLFAVNLDGDDGARYMQEAVNLVRYHTFSHLLAVPPSPTAHDLPAFPAIASVVIYFVKSVPFAGKLISMLNSFAYAGAALAVYRITGCLGGSPSVSAMAMILFGFSPESLPYSVFHMPESMFLFVFLMAVYYAIIFWQEQRIRYGILAFWLSAVSIWFKPISTFYFAVLIMVAVAVAIKTRRRAQCTAVIVAGCLIQLLMIAPWMARNQRDFGYDDISDVTGFNLFECNYRYMLEDLWHDQAKTAKYLSDLREKMEVENPALRSDPLAQARLMATVAAAGIRAHPLAYFKTTLIRHPRLYAGTGTVALFRLLGLGFDDPLAKFPEPRIKIVFYATQLVSWLILLCIYLCVFRGLVVLYRAGQHFALAVILVNIGYFAFIIGPVVATRYRMTLLPFFAIAAAFGIPLGESASKFDCGTSNIPQVINGKAEAKLRSPAIVKNADAYRHCTMNKRYQPVKSARPRPIKAPVLCHRCNEFITPI